MSHPDSFACERLEEALRIGEEHWKAVDGKKSPSPCGKPPRKRCSR
jgi:hypothetical protein